MRLKQAWFYDVYHAIFWLWNLIFLATVASLMPTVLIPLVRAIGAGEIESVFLLPLGGLLVIPGLCTWLGWRHFRQRPVELMRLFYGVEAPAFLLCLVRLFLLRDLTPASVLVGATVLGAIATFSVELLAGARRTSRVLAHLQTGAAITLGLVGAWAGALLLIYALPVAKFMLVEVLSFRWLRDLGHLVFNTPGALLPVGLFMALFAISATLFLALPSALAALYLQAGQRLWRTFARDYGRTRLLQVGLGSLTTWLVLFLTFNQQPQVAAFARLEADVTSPSARQALLAEADSLRRGLTNAYLASYRYLGSRQEGMAIAQLYQEAFDLPEAWAALVQGAHDGLLAPFLYQGSMGEDAARAARQYAAFFDQPIQKGEQTAILRALQSTAILDDAQAGTLNINQRRVLLAEQQVTVKEQGDWADVELYEVYQNQTLAEEEIFYAFSLPESAVITGLWLGDTAARDRRFPFRVSPRGAAQTVYKEQVNRINPVDPALLEQVGPHHYRLRAFPIPPRRRSWETEPLERPTAMHLWLTYRVMQQEGRWPLPQLSERRNIFWSRQTQRWRNGDLVGDLGDRWLEASLPAQAAEPRRHTATLAGYQVQAEPLPSEAAQAGQSLDWQVAVILDTSYSMGPHQAEVQAALEALAAAGWADGDRANGEAELYVAQAAGLEPQRFANLQQFDLAQQPSYGSLQLTDLLTQFATLRRGQAYDAVLLLTDAGSYELADDRATVPAGPEPLWVVHLGGEFPAGYQDGVLKALQDSHGGVATTIPAVLARWANTVQQQQRLANSATQLASVVDGYRWTLEPAAAASGPGEPGFLPLAARQLVQGLSRATTGQLAQLDQLQAIAKAAAIVTPYSSMIVLVNDEQRQALAAAEAASDRFERQVEDGQELLNQPFSPLQAGDAASIPEPGLLLGLAVILGFLSQSRRA